MGASLGRMHDDTRDVGSLWRSRLRWRLRGALLWPVLVVLTLADAVLLGRLPVAGDDGTPFVPALLLAMFFNLVALAVVAPLVSRRLRRRRPDLPKVVADDRAGATVVCVVSLCLLAGGLLHRPQVDDVQHDLIVQQDAARDFIAREAPPEFRGRTTESTSIKLEDELFRTCAPGDDPKRWFCVFVSTDTAPPGVVEDIGREPNDSFDERDGFR